MRLVLIHEDTDLEVKRGDVVTDFRGDKSVITGMQEPRHSSSEGRVLVADNAKVSEAESAAYYPSVFGLKWVIRK